MLPCALCVEGLVFTGHGASIPAAQHEQQLFQGACRCHCRIRYKDKDKNHTTRLTTSITMHPDSNSSSSHISRPLTQSTNIFSLIKCFTFHPFPNETHLPFPPPLLPPENQYWVSMIMWNACCKDKSCGGIQQYTNMLYSKWETTLHNFKKCGGVEKPNDVGKSGRAMLGWKDIGFGGVHRRRKVRVRVQVQVQVPLLLPVPVPVQVPQMSRRAGMRVRRVCKRIGV